MREPLRVVWSMEAVAEAFADPCPIGPVVDLIFGRWTSHILYAIKHGRRLRFSEVQAKTPFITPKILTERLRHLERNGFLRRIVSHDAGRYVAYEATPLAESLIPVFGTLLDWSAAHIDEVHSAQAAFDARSRLIS